jgi:hypothetical protein
MAGQRSRDGKSSRKDDDEGRRQPPDAPEWWCRSHKTSS